MLWMLACYKDPSAEVEAALEAKYGTDLTVVDAFNKSNEAMGLTSTYQLTLVPADAPKQAFVVEAGYVDKQLAITLDTYPAMRFSQAVVAQIDARLDLPPHALTGQLHTDSVTWQPGEPVEPVLAAHPDSGFSLEIALVDAPGMDARAAEALCRALADLGRHWGSVDIGLYKPDVAQDPGFPAAFGFERWRDTMRQWPSPLRLARARTVYLDEAKVKTLREGGALDPAWIQDSVRF